MIKQSLDNVLVLEDDAQFVHLDWTSEDSAYQELLRDLPPDYDILFLCGRPGAFNYGEKLTERLYLGQHSRQASMYLISQKGARNMLRSLPMVSCIPFFALLLWHMAHTTNFSNLVHLCPLSKVENIDIQMNCKTTLLVICSM